LKTDSLFVCCYKPRKYLLRLPPWARSKTPGSISTRATLFLRSYQRYTTAPELICLLLVFCVAPISFIPPPGPSLSKFEGSPLLSPPIGVSEESCSPHRPSSFAEVADYSHREQGCTVAIMIRRSDLNSSYVQLARLPQKLSHFSAAEGMRRKLWGCL